jgi:hypothetical protein
LPPTRELDALSKTFDQNQIPCVGGGYVPVRRKERCLMMFLAVVFFILRPLIGAYFLSSRAARRLIVVALGARPTPSAHNAQTAQTRAGWHERNVGTSFRNNSRSTSRFAGISSSNDSKGHPRPQDSRSNSSNSSNSSAAKRVPSGAARDETKQGRGRIQSFFYVFVG